jgi:hypothetical protein
MAELVSKWIASNGKMFDAEQDAVYEEQVIQLAEFIEENGYEYCDLNSEVIARALMKAYKVEKL